jgi:hypothetical protein
MGSPLYPRFFPGTTNPYQMIGLMAIYIPVGVTFTLGVTPLDTPGIIVTTADGTYKPYSYLPDNGPVAIWAASGTAYNCNSDFALDVIGTAQDFADAGLTTFYNAILTFADTIWRMEGAAAAMDATQYTSYFPTLNFWELFASTDANRFIHRAVHYSAHFRDHVLGLGPTWTTWQVNEAHSDVVTHLVDAMLTGDHSYLAGASYMLYNAEFGQIQRGTGQTNLIRSGSGRRSMHTNHGLAWFERMQVVASTVPGGHAQKVLSLTTNGAGHGDQEGWLNADGTSLLDGVNLVSPPDNFGRFRRMHEFQTHWMLTDTGPYAAQNAGLRFLNLSDYQSDPAWRDHLRTLLAAAPSAAVQGNVFFIFLKTIGEMSHHGLSKPLKAND